MNISNGTKSRWKIILATILVVFCMLLSSCAEKTQEDKIYRVGILSGADPFVSIAEGFKVKMTELGYVEGENIIYDAQRTNFEPDREQQILQKFVDDKVDLIFTSPSEPTVAAKTITQGTDIPVVFALAGIEGNNLVNSVRQPGGHVTGVRFPGPRNTGKRLEILHELVPEAKRVYIIYDSNYPNANSSLEVLRSTSLSLGLILVEDPIETLEDFHAALQVRAASDDIGIDAILIMPDLVSHSPDGFGAILKFANEHKIPVGGDMDFTADLGAIFGYAAKNNEIGESVAVIADKILKGTPAGTIPIVTPVDYLRINYKVAQELGIEVPEGLLARADKIIR